jgi:hypothetical protein
MTVEAGVILTLVLAVVSFAGAYGGSRARLAMLERSTRHAHRRIDEHLNHHIEGTL